MPEGQMTLPLLASEHTDVLCQSAELTEAEAAAHIGAELDQRTQAGWLSATAADPGLGHAGR
jgi:hypothetical protein